MTLRQRVAALNAEASHIYQRIQRHYEACGCWDRLFASRRLDIDHDCIVGLTLRHAWVGLREAAALPSLDARMYRDEPGETTTAVVTAGGATT